VCPGAGSQLQDHDQSADWGLRKRLKGLHSLTTRDLREGRSEDLYGGELGSVCGPTAASCGQLRARWRNSLSSEFLMCWSTNSRVGLKDRVMVQDSSLLCVCDYNVCISLSPTRLTPCPKKSHPSALLYIARLRRQRPAEHHTGEMGMAPDTV